MCPILDNLVGELNTQFSSDFHNIFNGIGALNPAGNSFLNIEELAAIGRKYSLNCYDDL